MTYNGGCEAVSFGAGLVGVLYASAGNQPRPAAILLHGIPGAEKNADIAAALRDMGWHALILSFAGAWGSGGDFNMLAQPDDVIDAVDYLLTPGQPWQIDPQRVALVGFSLGCRAALVAARRDARIGAVAAIAGIADFDEVMLSDDFFTHAARFSHGANANAIKRQWAQLGGADNPITVIRDLKQPTVIVHGTDDDVVPFYMGEALKSAGGSAVELLPLRGADHTFTHHRRWLVEQVTRWLSRWAK
jgi:hypothetical protein